MTNGMTPMMKEEVKKISESVYWDEPLSRHTSLRVGGPADIFVYPKSVEELSCLLAFSKENQLPVFVMGSGSNLVVRDKGIRGLVIHLSQGFNEIRVIEEDEETREKMRREGERQKALPGR